MECACIDAYVDEYTTVLSDTKPTARKQHECGECYRIIAPGEKYRLEKTAFDGSMSTHKTCLDCSSVREHLVCSFFWGEIWELVRESFGPYDDRLPWAKIGRLTPAARDRVCEIIEDGWG